MHQFLIFAYLFTSQLLPREGTRSKKYNIICLQGTHINKSIKSFIKVEWGNEAYFSSYTINSRGVMILINYNFEQKVIIIKTENNKRAKNQYYIS